MDVEDVASGVAQGSGWLVAIVAIAKHVWGTPKERGDADAKRTREKREDTQTALSQALQSGEAWRQNYDDCRSLCKELERKSIERDETVQLLREELFETREDFSRRFRALESEYMEIVREHAQCPARIKRLEEQHARTRREVRAIRRSTPPKGIPAQSGDEE